MEGLAVAAPAESAGPEAVGRAAAADRAIERRAPPAHLELALLDPQVARELGIVAANLLDESLDVLASR